MAGKVTVGLASHWPHVTDISGSPPTGSSGKVLAGLAINRSRVQIPASPLSSTTLGKLLIYVPLSPSSIIWYKPMAGDALWLGR